MSHSVPATYRTTPQASKRRLGRASLMAWATAASSLAAFLFTAPLYAETFNLADSPALYGVGSDASRDRIDLTKEGEARYHLTYHNNVARHSTGGNYSATHGTLVVRFYVEIGDAETVYVTPAEPWVSIPPQLDIEDGDTGLFLIVLPMY